MKRHSISNDLYGNSRFKTHLESLQQNLSSKESSINSLKQDLSNKESTIASLRQELLNKNNLLNEVNIRHANALNQKEIELSNKLNIIGSLEKEIIRSKTYNKQLEQEVIKKDEKIRLLKDQAKDKKVQEDKDIEELPIKQDEEPAQETIFLRREIELYKASCFELKNSLEQKNQLLDLLTETIGDLKEEKQDLKTSLKNKKSKIKLKEQKIESLEVKIKDILESNIDNSTINLPESVSNTQNDIEISGATDPGVLG